MRKWWPGFNGRVSRPAFLSAMGAWVCVIWAVDLCAQTLGWPIKSPIDHHFVVVGLNGTNGNIAFYPAALAALCLMPFYLSFVIRRLHDSGKSGWWILFSGVSISFATFKAPDGLDPWVRVPALFASDLINQLFSVQALLVYYLLRSGTNGANRFGPDPLPDDSELVHEGITRVS